MELGIHPRNIPSGVNSTALVANNRALSGVTGGLMFQIDLEDYKKYVYIGFFNPAVGSYKIIIRHSK